LTFLHLESNQLSGTIPKLEQVKLLGLSNNCGLTPYDAAQTTLLNRFDPEWQIRNFVCSINPTNLTFNSTIGAGNPATQTFTIDNGSSGVLTWTATVSGGNWLNLSAMQGTAPSTVTVSVNPNGLSSGNYAGEIILSAVSAKENSPQSVKVNLTLNESPNNNTFKVERDGLAFINFDYDESGIADNVKWGMFKKTFPATQMELTTGERRKGTLAYYNSTLYQGIGYGGNCAGFTGVSLVRYLGLTETVEPSLLSTASRAITIPHSWLNSSDVKDYLHLYQARQHSQPYIRWWNGYYVKENNQWVIKERHFDDKPLQTYQAIKTATQKNEPVAVSIYQGIEGHRMTAYRTEENGNMGYIYVYDSNWPNDSTRRIEINLTTGRWQYTLWAGEVWSHDQTNLLYSPAHLNWPGQLWDTYDTDIAPASRQSAKPQPNETILTINGAANVLITDGEGHALGYQNGQFVSTTANAAPMFNEGFNPDNPNASNLVGFYLAHVTPYTVTIHPLEANSAYTVTAFGNGSAMQLSQLSIATQTVDTLLLNGSVLSTTFKPATDNAYCQTLTAETTTASREFVSCVNGQADAAVTFGLTDTGLTIKNEGARPVTVTTKIDQIGADAQQTEVTSELPSGQTVTIKVTGGKVYLPIIVK